MVPFYQEENKTIKLFSQVMCQEKDYRGQCNAEGLHEFMKVILKSGNRKDPVGE